MLHDTVFMFLVSVKTLQVLFFCGVTNGLKKTFDISIMFWDISSTKKITWGRYKFAKGDLKHASEQNH